MPLKYVVIDRRMGGHCFVFTCFVHSRVYTVIVVFYHKVFMHFIGIQLQL